jgi:hypothetical protein
MRSTLRRHSVAAMTDDLLLANLSQGAPMIAALLGIAVVVWLVSRVRSRRPSDRSDDG